MKAPTALTLAALLGLATVSAFSAPLSDKEQTVIRQEVSQVLQEHISGAEHVDCAAALKFAADVPEFRYADSDGKQYDYAGYKKVTTDLLAGMSAIKVVTRNQEILVLGPDTALVIWHGAVDLTQKDGSVLRADPYNAGFLFKRFGGTWMMVFQQESCLPPHPVAPQAAKPAEAPTGAKMEVSGP